MSLCRRAVAVAAVRAVPRVVASPDFHPLIARAKDAAAGAVLVAAIGAAVVGLLVLGPPLLARIG